MTTPKLITSYVLKHAAKRLGTGVMVLILLAFCTTVAKGQFFIQIGDTALKPVDFASVGVVPISAEKGLEYNRAKLYYTDAKGMVQLEFGGKCLLKIQAEGFKAFEDSVEIVAGKTLKIKLYPFEAEVSEVVVTGVFEPTHIDKSISKIRVIDMKRIEGQGAVNLNDVLSNELNIRLKRDNILGSSMSLQGIGGQNVKILIDGVPMIGRMDGNIDLGQINLNNIEKIEIVEGPMSVMYGTDALGGVINLITKKTTKNSIEGNVNSYYESAGQYNLDGRVAFSTPKKTSVQVSGGRNFFDGYEELGTYKRAQAWKPKEQYFADVIVGFSIKNTTHRLQSTFFDELLLNKGEPVVGPYSVYAFDNYFYTRRFNNSLFSNIKLKNGGHIQLINSYSWFRRHNIQMRKNLVTLENVQTQGSTDHDTSTFDLWLSRGIYTVGWGKNATVQVGYDINIETGTGRRIEGTSQSIGDYAGYTTVEYKPLRRLVIRPGVRASYNTKYGAPITPSFNTKYDINKNLSARASYARGFRAPSLKELSLFFVDMNHNIQPNDNLKAEISDNFNASFLYTRTLGENSSIRFEPSFFYNDIRNMISLAVVDPAKQLYSYVNIGAFTNAGTNLNTEFKTKQITLQLGASYIANKNLISGPNVSKFSTTQEYKANVTYTVPVSKTSISVFYKYNGKVPGYMLDAGGNVMQTYIQDYSMADLSVSQSFLGQRVTLVIGSRNIFNVIRISYNAPTGGAHSGGGNSMGIGMGRTIFTNIKIHLFKQDKR